MKFLSAIMLCLVFFTITLSSQPAPISDLVEPKILKEKSVLPYPEVQERDIMWKKYVWRIIDV